MYKCIILGTLIDWCHDSRKDKLFSANINPSLNLIPCELVMPGLIIGLG